MTLCWNCGSDRPPIRSEMTGLLYCSECFKIKKAYAYPLRTDDKITASAPETNSYDE